MSRANRKTLPQWERRRSIAAELETRRRRRQQLEWEEGRSYQDSAGAARVTIDRWERGKEGWSERQKKEERLRREKVVTWREGRQ